MKRIAALVVIAMLLSPGVALAGSSTDAALGLGAFAVFNQIISGTGIFGHSASAVGTRRTVIERQVVVAPPPPVVVAPQPVVVYQTPVPIYYQTYVQYVPAYRAWVPPGHAKHGRWHKHWRHHDDD